jgi:hypothetical protein
MLAILREQLTGLEAEVAAAVFTIDEARFDQDASLVVSTGQVLQCRLRSDGDVCCPFEMHFVRGSASRFSFYLGLGAEVYNFEDLGDPDALTELASDVEAFLRSETRCERFSKGGKVVKEVYLPSRLRAGTRPLKFVYRSGFGPFFGLQKEEFSYAPWLP